jgi:Zn-dependent protease
MLQSGGFDAAAFITWVVALAIGITVHEFGHAYRAEKAGDPTPRQNGRVSLYPWDHYDPIGTTLILLFGLGWAKPVPTNPFMFRHPRRDEIMVSLWGPLANLLVAVAFAIPVRFGLVPAEYVWPIASIIRLQLLLAVFNLIPIYPLDGSHVLSALLPVPAARRLDAIYRQSGPVLLIVVFMVAGNIVWPVVTLLMRLLLGVD